MLATTVVLTLFTAAFAIPLKRHGEKNSIPGKYIVKFKENIHITAIQQIRSMVAAPTDHEYSFPGFTGFSATLSDDETAILYGSGFIEYIQQDAVVSISAIERQYNASWGLARISHRQSNCTTFAYDDTAGEGTCAYVIDTGIETDHPEFQGRADFLVDTSGENKLIDGFGHGTHVAGTIGSATWGVAKKTQLFAVKVLRSNGHGTNAGVIAGINYVYNDAQTRREKCPKGIVSNMSLGGNKNAAVNEAASPSQVAALVSSGVFLAVAAGNEGFPASYSSPASEPSVCTVGATNIFNRLPEWSNWGPLVDVLAPGENITSTWIGGGIKEISGTSMAAPHVAGLAAYLMGMGGPMENGLCEVIAAMATKGVVDLGTWQEGTPNSLVWNGVEEEGLLGKRFGGARTS